LQNRTGDISDHSWGFIEREFGDTQSFSRGICWIRSRRIQKASVSNGSILHLMSSDLQIEIFSSYSATPELLQLLTPSPQLPWCGLYQEARFFCTASAACFGVSVPFRI
jgi:hypothetical protein